MTATWKDVTSMLRAAAGELTNQNPMVQTENFSLNDSMAAVEIMDPIMDQCCGITGSMKQQDLLTVQYPADTIAVYTAVRLCQALFIYEAGFLDGASLMESIKQCIFSWEGSWATLQERGASSVTDRAVLAYCQSLVFSTGSQFTAVMAADIYEDEDFQPGYRSLLSDKSLSGEQLLTELKSVITELENSSTKVTEPALEVSYLVHLLKARLQLQQFFQHTGHFAHTTIQEYSSLLKKRNANHAAALARAEKRSEQIEQGLAPAADEPGGNSLEQALEQAVQSQKKRSQESCKGIHKLAKETAAVLEQLLEFHNTHNPDTSANLSDSIFSDISHPNECPEISFALSSKLVKLHQTGPIRRVSMKSYTASVQYVQAICREFCDVTTTTASFFQRPTVLTVAAATTAIMAGNKSVSAKESAVLTLDHVLSTALHASAAGLHLLSRGYFLSVLYVLSVEIAALIWASMFSHGLPRTLIESDLVSLHWIQGNPSAAVWETLKGVVVCRSRLLASRLQNMLDLWSHVASEAIYVDSRFHADINGPEVANKSPTPQLQWCSLWALQYTVQVMDLHMALVVEMDLVGLEEWDYFYWYWDYLCSTGVFTAEKLRNQRFQLDMQMYETAKAEAAARSAENKKSSGKKGKKGSAVSNGGAEVNALPPMLPVKLPPSREELLLKGRGMLCRGVYRMCALAGAAPLGKGTEGSGAPLIDKSEGRYSSWETKFAHRFLAFAQLSNPPPLSYSDFQRATGKAATADSNSGAVVVVRDPALLGNLVQGAMLCYQNARKVFDEARLLTSAAATPTGPNTAIALADKYAQVTMVSLTKVSVASALASMKAGQLIKDSAAALQTGSAGRGVCALGVNRSYNKHFSVLEITPPPTSST